MSKPATKPPTPTSDVPTLPPRAPETHKGQAGHVAVVAGSRGMSGAAILTGLGALRGGAGLVRVYCARSVQPLVAAANPCLMTVALDENEDGRLAIDPSDWAEHLSWAHVLGLGPGIGQGPDMPALVRGLVEGFGGPAVIDADGLNNLATDDADKLWEQRRHRPTVVTPHPGEMARLRSAAGLAAMKEQDDETRLRCAHEYAATTGMVVVLKGHRTVVATADRAYVNTTGNPGMATGGMGDVLTGVIAALLAQGLDAYEAARFGVYVHGLAGDMCARQIAPVGFLASDLVEQVPKALAQTSRAPIGFR